MSELILPPLRENLSVTPEDDRRSSEKNWIVYDHIAHRFHQIGHVEYLILSLWHLGTKAKILQILQSTYHKVVKEEHFDEFFQFLVVNRLLKKSGYTDAFTSPQKPFAEKFKKLQKIFFVRIRLIRPDALLNRVIPYFRWVFSKYFHFVMLFLMAMGVAGVIQNFESYKVTFIDFLEFSDLGLWFAALIFIKIVHEISHALTAKNYGCKVSAMGVAFMIFWPVLYTDTTDAWSLKNRKQRIFISSAGVISEIYLAAICSLLWLLLPDGTLKSVTFLLSGTAWITSLLVNSNPFMRFDGYFVLSDILKVPNLHYSAGYCIQQYIDSSVFGLKKKPDLAYISKSMRPKLAFFGAMMWVYRFFLVSAILLLLYNLVFKLLALVLMALYITSSIFLPLAHKISQLRGAKMDKINKKVVIRTAVVFACLMAVIFIPWRSKIEVPAILHFEDSSTLYANDNATVEQLLVKQGEWVEKGQILAILKSPALDYKLKQVVLDADVLQWKYKITSLSREYQALMQTTRKELAEKQSEYERYNNKKEQLVVKAPHDGTVFFSERALYTGMPFAKDQEVLSVVDIQHAKVTGYLEENVVSYFENNSLARFYAQDPSFGVQDVEVNSLSLIGKESLSHPYLASLYGGKIVVRKDEETNELIPEKGVYGLQASVINYVHDDGKLSFITRGTLVMQSKPYSIGGAWTDFIYASFLKHSSF